MQNRGMTRVSRGKILSMAVRKENNVIGNFFFDTNWSLLFVIAAAREENDFRSKIQPQISF